MKTKGKVAIALYLVFNIVFVLGSAAYLYINDSPILEIPSVVLNDEEQEEITEDDNDNNEIDIADDDDNQNQSNQNDNNEDDHTDVVAQKEGVTSQTVMIYIIGSDLESEVGAATLDLEEIEMSGIDTTVHNVIVFTGGATKWQNGMSADDHGIYRLEGNELVEVESMDRMNMTDAKTLTTFLDWTYENYKTDSYSLVLWDHGGGPNVGYGHDEFYSMDCLTLPEMSASLEASPFNGDNKLEWVSFDACLMASVEVAGIFEPYANYLIASQEAEPAYGHDYKYLEILNDEGVTGLEVGQEVVDTYMDYYDELYTQAPSYTSDITISCLDLNKYDDVKASMESLFLVATDGMIQGDYARIVRGRVKTKSFGSYTTSTSFDLVDLEGLSAGLITLYPEAKELKDALDDFVVSNESNVEGANGVSIYYPYSNMEYAEYWMEEYDTLSASDNYTEFLRNFMLGEDVVQNIIIDEEQEQPENDMVYEDVDWTFSAEGTIDRDEMGFSIKLTPEQQQYTSVAEVKIIAKQTSEEAYGLRASVSQVTMDEKGELFVPIKNNLVQANTITGESAPILTLQPEVNRGLLQTPIILLIYSPFDTLAGEMNLQLNPDGETYTILQVVESADDQTAESVAAKQTLDINDFDYISTIWNGRIPTYDENGKIKHVSEWELTGVGEGVEFDIKEDKPYFTVTEIKEEDKDQYFAQYTVKDIFGNYHISDLVPLK